MINSNKHILDVFITKLLLNIKSEAAKTKLSYAWWVLEPSLLVGTFYLVFAVFLANGVQDYVVFLVCGIIPFYWFSRSVNNSAGSILAGRGIINQVYIPKMFFPLLVIFQDAVKQSVVFILLIVFLFVYGMEASWVWLTVLFVIFTQFILIMSVSVFVAGVIPFFPDFRFILDTGMMMLMFGSGIFYSYREVLLQEHQSIYLMNPMALLLKNYRQVFMENSQPDWSALLVVNFLCIVFILLMIKFYRTNDREYARLVIQ